VGRESTGVAERTSRIVAEPSDDHRLVAAVRRGDDRAFEALYGRYHRRIHAYVIGMVKDHGRAEDVTQEVFVAALRRMRETERPIAFKPWIYEIAKNACIDQFRRSRRTEEVSLQADEGFAPSDYGRLVGSDPTPDAAVAAKQDLDHLCGAFGGLSDTHHEILVMREFEGMSYREIGERMGMSRPAVESTLFRARRRLTEEYDDLVSGARCQRIQSLIAAAGESRLGTRESRRLSRHVAHCQPCRREAIAAGVDSAILTHVPLRKRAADKIAALLPFGWFGRGRGADDGGATASLASGGGGRWTAHLPILSDQLSGGWGKLATAAAVVVAGVGAAGVGTQIAQPGDDLPHGGAPPAAANDAGAAPSGGGGTGAGATRSTQGVDKQTAAKKPAKRDRAGRRGERRRASGDSSGDGTGAAAPVGVSSGGDGGGSGGGGSGSGGGLPQVELPAGGQDPTGPVRPVVEGVTEPLQPVVDGATETVEQATEPVEETVGDVNETVDETTDGILP
jgi:RNA polymerase sigma factor (sigma-70 family)